MSFFILFLFDKANSLFVIVGPWLDITGNLLDKSMMQGMLYQTFPAHHIYPFM